MAVAYTLNPAKEQYVVITEIAAPIEKCFAAASEEAAMMNWAPGAKSIVYDHSKASEPYGAGSERVVTLNNGMALVERIHVSETPTLVKYNIPSFGPIARLVQDYQGKMVFEALDANRTRLIWTGYFNAKGLAKITEPVMRLALKTMISKMASALKKHVEKR